jgi:DNA-binding response OmpR family regulator
LSPNRRHLLVVDDEPHIGLLLRPHLERLGYVVSLARTLAEARGALQSDAAPLDAMLLDLHLPDGSGLDLLRELRGRAATRALPVIVLTAEGEDRILGEAERLGAGLLTKPFSPSKLTARIAAMLGDAPPPPSSGPPQVPPDPR